MRPLRAALTAGLLVALSACGGDAATESSDATGAAAQERDLTVFAAASLQQTFEQLGKDLEAQHPGLTVTFSFAGSSDLVAQLTEGAPADVLATADEANMDKAVTADLVAGAPRLFATNSMTIAVPAGNPAGVTSFADLTKEGTTVVVCAPQVPCGAATERVEASTGVTLTPASEESKVTDVLGKVASGEADAGIVYVTDAAGSTDVETVQIPRRDNTTNGYPVAVLEGSDDAGLAQEFANLVVADGQGRGQGRLQGAGFAAP